MSWQPYEIEFLRAHYPQYGKDYCAAMLQKTIHQIRAKTHRLGLKKDPNSFHTVEWQSRAAASKVGKKRPNQSLVMKRLHAEGRLEKTPEQCAAIGQRIKKYLAEHGHPRGALGLKFSPEALEKMSAANKRNYAKLTEEQKAQRLRKIMETRVRNGTLVNPRLKTTWKQGWREVAGKRIYFRSKWEANYARYLQLLVIGRQISSWEHEPKVFWFDGIKRGCVSYLPDFRVINLDGSEEYHEVKGWMDSRSLTKIKRMAKYHPTVKLVVIDSAAYRSIAKNASRVIADWE